jgi:hypothetical protein
MVAIQTRIAKVQERAEIFAMLKGCCAVVAIKVNPSPNFAHASPFRAQSSCAGTSVDTRMMTLRHLSPIA